MAETQQDPNRNRTHLPNPKNQNPKNQNPEKITVLLVGYGQMGRAILQAWHDDAACVTTGIVINPSPVGRMPSQGTILILTILAQFPQISLRKLSFLPLNLPSWNRCLGAIKNLLRQIVYLFLWRQARNLLLWQKNWANTHS